MMRKWLVQGGICLIFVLAVAGTARAEDQPGTKPVQFDLASMQHAKRLKTTSAEPRSRMQIAFPLEEPRPAEKKFKAPAAEMPLGRKGATLGVGAFGSRHRRVPKLAHVVLDWDF